MLWSPQHLRALALDLRRRAAEERDAGARQRLLDAAAQAEARACTAAAAGPSRRLLGGGNG